MGDAAVLRAASVRTVFGIPGLHTLGLYDALAGAPDIRHILTRHEQGAAFAADGYARVSGSPGVVSTTTGPGTFNTLAAVADAWLDSSPVVILAGQIDAALDGLGRGVLHETPDQGRSFEALTAYVGRPRDATAIPVAVAAALTASMTGRPRPAYVELPTDLLNVELDEATPPVELPGPVDPDADTVVAAARVLAAARRIVIVPGAGVQARAALPRYAILTHDAARLNSWTGFVWPVYEPDGSIFPWGSATLSFALGTANGAAVAAPGRRVVASCGDGGFLFTAMELATAVAHELDVTVLVHDDAAFGSIAEYQRRFHGRTYATDLHNPDLVAFARSFGVRAERVDAVADLSAATARATAAPGPSVVVLASPLGQPWD